MPSSPTAKAPAPVTLITGASSGLGAGLARELARRGHDLALCARRIEQMKALRSAILADHPSCRIEIAALDVNNHDAVFTVFADLERRLGRLDRVVVNAGIGAGAPIGKGGFQRNVAVINTNFTAALAQCEAAMASFRAAECGHLVVVSSMSAIRGLRGGLTAYAASKAGVAALAEGIRADVRRRRRIRVTTLYPGYIRTEINAHAPSSQTPFIIDLDKGCRLLADAIARAPSVAYVPWLPWRPLAALMRILPFPLAARLN